jgi:uncharacterized protein with ParB-like and HNH nuclease domain
MKVIMQTLKGLLEDRAQYSVPIYQRDYDWSIDECDKLMFDILGITDLGHSTHFLGPMIYTEKSVSPGEYKRYGVVDGQQRMTTLSILFKSVLDYFEYRGINMHYLEDIKSHLYFNHKGQKFNKLVLKKTDDPIYVLLLENRFKQIEQVPEYRFSNIYKNYKHFDQMLRRMPELDIPKLIDNSACLEISYHGCERGKDDPQTIFQNQKLGKDLAHSDYILNYSLQFMEDVAMDSFYETYWLSIKKVFSDEKELEDFIRNYITIRNGSKPKDKKLFDEYKKIKGDQSDIIIDLHKYSNFYDKIYNGKELNKKVKVLFDDGLSSTSYLKFFLLYLYNDYDNGIIDENNLLEILIFLRNYVIRRNVYFDKSRDTVPMFCELMELLDICKRDSVDKYVEQVKVFFLLQTRDELKIPTDDEVIKSLLDKNLYKSPYIRVILDGLEKWYNQKEVIDFSKLTIEHVLPQNPLVPQSWKDELGPDYLSIKEDLCHNLGNLTLTGYNPKLSDKSFQDKKTMENGLSSSQIYLNDYFKEIEKWDKESIIERCNHLSKIFNKVFPYPEIDFKILEKYKNREIERIPYFENHRGVYEYLITRLGLEESKKDVYTNKVVFDSYQIKFNKKSINITLSDNDESKVTLKDNSDVDKYLEL